jgi:hypothetical protein
MSKNAPLPSVSVPEIPVPELPAQVPTSIREVRLLWPIVGLLVLGTVLVLTWAVVQATSTVAPERVFVDHDSGISLQVRQLEMERARAIETAHDATIASLLQERSREFAAYHDAGIAALLQLQADRDAAIASAYDSGLAAALETQAEKEAAIATAYDSGIAALLRSQAGTPEVLGSTCSTTPPNSGGWEVQYHRFGC